jgi:hypothetical protein
MIYPSKLAMQFLPSRLGHHFINILLYAYDVRDVLSNYYLDEIALIALMEMRNTSADISEKILKCT